MLTAHDMAGAKGPRMQFKRSDVLLPIFLGAHGLGMTLFPSAAAVISYSFIIAAALLAAIACIYRATSSKSAEGWFQVGLAMLLWAAGMAAVMYSDVVMADAHVVYSAGMLLFVLYAVPLIFALASPVEELWHVRLVDCAMAVVLGSLFYIHTSTFSPLALDAGWNNQRLIFDIENAFIALFALTRFYASNDGSRRAFFSSLAVFAFAYLVVASYINHSDQAIGFGVITDVVIGLPFMLLFLAALRSGKIGQGRPWNRPLPALQRIVRAGSPLMLPAMLLVVSGLLVTHTPALAVAGFVVALLGYGLRNVLVQVHGDTERDRLDELTRTDQLTGLPNRRHFDESLQREWNRARRAQTGLAVLMIDIDHFKLLNDGLGHQVGDLRLRAVARALARCAARAEDLVARYGGEEFVAVLPSTSADEAKSVAETMRETVATLRLETPAPGEIVTISVGLGWVGEIDTDEPSELIAAADAALYDAKRAGRNCVRTRQGDAPLLWLAAG